MRVKEKRENRWDVCLIVGLSGSSPVSMDTSLILLLFLSSILIMAPPSEIPISAAQPPSLCLCLIPNPATAPHCFSHRQSPGAPAPSATGPPPLRQHCGPAPASKDRSYRPLLARHRQPLTVSLAPGLSHHQPPESATAEASTRLNLSNFEWKDTVESEKPMIPDDWDWEIIQGPEEEEDIAVGPSSWRGSSVVLMADGAKNCDLSGVQGRTGAGRAVDETALTAHRTSREAALFAVADVTLIAEDIPVAVAELARVGVGRRQPFHALLQLAGLVEAPDLLRSANVPPADEDLRQG
nr:hypothetical protein Iba_chr12dCG17050 [Ipomoea batatas]